MTFSRPYLFRYRASRRAFSLIEILVATAILAMLTLLLVSVSNQAGNIWQNGETDNQYRQRARLALNFIGRELGIATLPIIPSTDDSLHFQINANTHVPTAFRQPDTLFFQAPLADEVSEGKMVAFGYFVGWNGNTPTLYRLCLGASDSRYIPGNPNEPVAAVTGSTTTLEEFAFLENVLGFWVTAYDANGNAQASWDSRVSHSLPASVKVDLLLVDSRHAARITAPISFSHSEISDPDTLLSGLPDAIRPGVRFVSLKVSLDNSLSSSAPPAP